MADLEAYRDKFGESGQRVLQNALNESRLRGQNYVGVEHIISALAKSEPELFDSTMRALSLDPGMVTQAVNYFRIVDGFFIFCSRLNLEREQRATVLVGE